MIAPLAGCKVIELGTMITAPLAGMMLGDLGAEVVKIERPDGGDPFRSFKGGLYSPHFVAFNRNKQSIVVDLQSADGRDLVLRLAGDSDVLIDNFRPGVLDRLALSAEVLRARNPRLIHCSIAGFGEGGPYSDRPAYDTVGQALSGIAGLSIDPASPKLMGTTISDNVTGMYACYAVLAALVERARTGAGRRIEVNMLEASVAFMPDAFMNYEMLRLCNGPLTRVSFSQFYVVRCRDQHLLALHLSSQEKFWRGLLDALGESSISVDTRFSSRDGRIRTTRPSATHCRPRLRCEIDSNGWRCWRRVTCPARRCRWPTKSCGTCNYRRLGSFASSISPDSKRCGRSRRRFCSTASA